MRTDAQQNREHLLAAARVMAREGRAPTLNALARQAGLGVATVYRHFPDTDALAAALMEKPLAELQHLFERVSGESDIGTALRALLIGALELQLENPLVAQLIHAPETTSESVVQLMASMRFAAERLVARARREKIVRPSVTGEDLCRLLLGIHAAALAGEQPLRAARRYADIVLAGLAPLEKPKRRRP